VVLCLGIFFLIPFNETFDISYKTEPWSVFLICLITLVLGYDFLEALALPTDGDSLAYHFSLAKSFLNKGELYPLYQAIEGTIPLLQQMTYMADLGTGGELTMTLWAMASGWAASAMLFVIARRFLNLNWSLALTLVSLTTPAVIYGAGSGQNEVRNASFVLVAALAVVEARRTDLLRYAALAGIAAFFCRQ